MKKIIASAVGIMMVGGVAATNASAVENIFGGYWRTRIFSQTDFDGVDQSFNRMDNRTRLYYTAKFSDDFKFVNKFEHNTNWGDDVGGDIGADGTGIFKVKNAYADFTLGNVKTKVGMLGNTVARGFIFSDDFSGMMVEPKFGNITVSTMWARVNGEYTSAAAVDEDILSAEVRIPIGDAGTIKPYFVYHGSTGVSELEAFYLGVDADMNFGGAKAWGSFIFEGGTAASGADNAGYLIAAGGSVSIVHGQIFYSTGDDTPLDGDNDAFAGTPGDSYYWSEIMGYGKFDNSVSNGSPGDTISNIFAVNVGVKAKPMEKLTLSADLWYANLAEENALGQDELGTEIDLVATYAVMDNLNLDLVAAYLFAGDATGEEDPVEIGARLSLSF